MIPTKMLERLWAKRARNAPAASKEEKRLPMGMRRRDAPSEAKKPAARKGIPGLISRAIQSRITEKAAARSGAAFGINSEGKNTWL